MKKLIVLVFTLIIILAFYACGEPDFIEDNNDGDEENTSGEVLTQHKVTTPDKEDIIFHAPAGDEKPAVLVYVTPMDDKEEIGFVIWEYDEHPGDYWFNLYNGYSGIYSDSMDMTIDRINMRNVEFDSEGMGRVDIVGTIKMTVSGNTMTYHVSETLWDGTVWTWSKTLSRITKDQEKALFGY